MGHGGKREGAGKPKGVKWPSTITKEAARELARTQILEALQPMIKAQITHAVGLNYLVARHKTSGKFVKLTQDVAEKVLSGEDDQYAMLEVWSKDPSVQAFTDLLNRALDKPKEQEQDVNLKGDLVIRWEGDDEADK